MKYKVGDKVIIKPYEYLISNDLIDEEGEMAEHWGGQTMTIKGIVTPCFGGIPYYYTMEEDDNIWCWYEELIEGLAGVQFNINKTDLLDFLM